jgi:1-acyl-sn-glycerol-3-phosphate acyltransferase
MRRIDPRKLEAFASTTAGRFLCDLPIGYFRATIEGAERLPRKGPALFVGNHAMMAVDSLVLASLVLRETGRHVRFLAERTAFRVPVLRALLESVGAVPGEPEAAVRLLRDGELVAVYPGGVDEGWKSTSTHRHRLMWGRRAGFARVALRAPAPVIPIAALGIDDAYDVGPRERWVGRRLFGSPRYDLPWIRGWLGTPIPRPVPFRYLVRPAIEPRGDPEDDAAAFALRSETFTALEEVLRPTRAASAKGDP